MTMMITGTLIYLIFYYHVVFILNVFIIFIN